MVNMLALHINNPGEIQILMRKLCFLFPAGVPFYNAVTSKVETTEKAYKGIYPVSILNFDEERRITSYRPEIIHHDFFNQNIASPILRHYQIPVFKEFLDHYNTSVNKSIPVVVHIKAPCGFGKSETSLKIITTLRIRSVIIVKTKILVNHWCGYLERYGISHYGSFDGAVALLKTILEQMVQLPDVLVIVSRHVENEDFVNFIQEHYSLCLIDEIHSWCLSGNSELSKFVITKPFPVNIYLTATPNQVDEAVYGKIIQASHPPEFNTLRRLIINYSKIDSSIVLIDDSKTDETLDQIQADTIRNSVIVTCILDFLSSCSIVYCNRRRHVDLLFSSVANSLLKLGVLDSYNPDSVLIKFNIGDRSFVILKGDAESPNIHSMIKNLSNCNSFVLITTVQFCACGLDLPTITNVMLALTSIDDNTLKQAVGRAERGPYTSDRRVFMFWTTKASGSMRGQDHITLKTKKVPGLFNYHPQNSYTQLYNKFIRDCNETKLLLQSIGWKNDTASKVPLQTHTN